MGLLGTLPRDNGDPGVPFRFIPRAVTRSELDARGDDDGSELVSVARKRDSSPDRWSDTHPDSFVSLRKNKICMHSYGRFARPPRPPPPLALPCSSPCELLVDIDEFHISVMTSRSWSADSDVDPISARTLRQSHYHNAFARSVTQRCQPWLRRGAVPGACGPHDRCSH